MIIDKNKIRYAIVPDLLGASGLVVIYDGSVGWGISNNGNCAVYDLRKVVMPIALFVDVNSDTFKQEQNKDWFQVTDGNKAGDLTYGSNSIDLQTFKDQIFIDIDLPLPDFPNATLNVKGTPGNTLNWENMDAAIMESWIMPELYLKLFYDDLTSKDLPNIPAIGHIKSDPDVEAAMMSNVLFSLNYFLNTIENG